MERLGVDELYIDRASGKNAQRPELQKMMEYVRRGDTVIVESISRFARNTRDLLELVERLTGKGVEFISQKEAIDTTTPTGKFMLTVFGAVAELEREYILQRQREGIAAAKGQGRYKGRKPIEPPGLDAVIRRWRAGELTAAEAMRKLNLSPARFIGKQKDSPAKANLFLYSWPKERFSADFRHTPALYLYNYGGEERSDRRPGPLLCQIEYNLWSGGAWKIFCRGSEQTSL